MRGVFDGGQDYWKQFRFLTCSLGHGGLSVPVFSTHRRWTQWQMEHQVQWRIFETTWPSLKHPPSKAFVATSRVAADP